MRLYMDTLRFQTGFSGLFLEADIRFHGPFQTNFVEDFAKHARALLVGGIIGTKCLSELRTRSVNTARHVLINLTMHRRLPSRQEKPLARCDRRAVPA